jgi:type VI secretion system protein ImpF
MARSLGETTITVSVLDRLIDLEPHTQTENQPTRAQSVRLLRNAVRRDLMWLLNTRRICDPPDKGFVEVNRSGYNFGLPDLSGYAIAASGDRARLMKQILDTIRLFEPRLKDPRLELVETPDASRRDVRLRIDALLRMDPVPEPISFDTVIELKTGSCRISGGEDAR